MKDTELELQSGTIIANYGSSLIVEDHSYNSIRCHARKSLGNLVCGDKVRWHSDGHEQGVITELKERLNVLVRPDMRGQQKLVASNIDQLLIITAPKPELNERLLDRYLVIAELNEMNPVIVLNKTDLLSEQELSSYRERLSVYQQIGYEVIYTSTRSEHGLDSLLGQLHNKTSILVGQSGVGKSSLLNQLLPDANARVGEVSESTNKGRHTTTTAWLYHLKNNEGSIIDSPGIREFGLWKVETDQLSFGFREFQDYNGQCKFRNCTHINTPGCAIQSAVQDNKISEQRYDSYVRLYNSIENGDM